MKLTSAIAFNGVPSLYTQMITAVPLAAALVVFAMYRHMRQEAFLAPTTRISQVNVAGNGLSVAIYAPLIIKGADALQCPFGGYTSVEWATTEPHHSRPDGQKGETPWPNGIAPIPTFMKQIFHPIVREHLEQVWYSGIVNEYGDE